MAGTTVRILTFNAAMVPLQASNERARAIAAAILAADVDVACLQEVFFEQIKNTLRKRLVDALPDVFWPGGPFSGLFFASRIPVAASRFETFDNADGLMEAGKGVFGARLDLGHGKGLLVCNTHLQSRRSAAAVRKKQLAQARKLVVRLIGKNPVAAMLAGDLNIRGELDDAAGIQQTPEYVAMLDLLRQPRDLYRLRNPNTPGFTWDPVKNPGLIPPGHKARERLDYVLAFDSVPLDDANVEGEALPKATNVGAGLAMVPSAGAPLSDHLGVVVTISI